jgi:hypothetical protein
VKAFGILALLGTAIGLLLCTERGKKLARDAGGALAEAGEQARNALQGRQSGSSELDQVVESALAQPHPDTPVARAFEEAMA